MGFPLIAGYMVMGGVAIFVITGLIVVRRDERRKKLQKLAAQNQQSPPTQK